MHHEQTRRTIPTLPALGPLHICFDLILALSSGRAEYSMVTTCRCFSEIRDTRWAASGACEFQLPLPTLPTWDLVLIYLRIRPGCPRLALQVHAIFERETGVSVSVVSRCPFQRPPGRLTRCELTVDFSWFPRPRPPNPVPPLLRTRRYKQAGIMSPALITFPCLVPVIPRGKF